MASLNDERSIVVTIVQASELPFPTFRSKAFRPKAYVETIAGGIHRRTQSVKQEKETYTRWDFKIDL
ncbi:hypothetical protein PILCRDRAFT_14598 [Piloderma croceum F 1598]|uniref:C2 domain-containing protein n=1 Tax=Piloderma croceum (strain F 1598) TaxID=765440 RepID=A0A0C3F2F5_PILCF|nr:hypothetical protein PILCRDRAFT_14598 [Piloderma croceum F 1598]